MLHGHRDKPRLGHGLPATCKPPWPRHNPRTRVFWLTIPVDAGRAGHSPVGQLTKVRDWLAGRDKDSDTSLAAYHRARRTTSSPPCPRSSRPIPVTEDMIDWFWRHNAFRGACTDPLPRRRAPDSTGRQPTAHRRVRRRRPSPPPGEVLVAALDPVVEKGAAGLPAPTTCIPTATRPSCPSSTHPAKASSFPAPKFLAALDDLDTGATFDFAIHLRNAQPAKWKPCATTAPKTTSTTSSSSVATSATATPNYAATRPPARRIPTAAGHQRRRTPPGGGVRHRRRAPPTNTPSTTASNGYAKSSAAPARSWCATTAAPRQRLWAAFNPGAAHHKTGVDQFSLPHHHRESGRGSCRSPPSQVGNSTGILLGFNQSNALNSAVLIDLPGTARRNHNPCLVCGGAPGYGKSYAAKRLVRGEIQRGSPGIHHRPRHRRMGRRAGRHPRHSHHRHGRRRIRLRPAAHLPRPSRRRILAGLHGAHDGPRLPQHRRGPAAHPAHRVRAPPTRHHQHRGADELHRQHPGPAQRPRHPTRPRRRTRRRPATCAVALQSWATYDFTQAIFDDTLPVTRPQRPRCRPSGSPAAWTCPRRRR